MQVTGTVALFPTTGPLPGTELDSPTAFTVLSTGNPLPTVITLTTTNPSPSGGFSQLQRYQSMRVAVPSFTVTGPTQGTLTETAETYVSTGQFWGTVTGDARPVREPGLEVLDPLTASEPTTIPRFDDNPELFEVDSLAMSSDARAARRFRYHRPHQPQWCDGLLQRHTAVPDRRDRSSNGNRRDGRRSRLRCGRW